MAVLVVQKRVEVLRQKSKERPREAGKRGVCRQLIAYSYFSISGVVSGVRVLSPAPSGDGPGCSGARDFTGVSLYKAAVHFSEALIVMGDRAFARARAAGKNATEAGTT